MVPQIQIEVISTFLIIFGAHTNTIFIIQANILEFIKESYNPTPPQPQIMMTTEPRMVVLFWAQSPIFFKHLSLW